VDGGRAWAVGYGWDLRPVVPRGAELTANDSTCLQLRQQRTDVVDRHGEADAEVRRGFIRVDGRIDADDLAADVQQRSARVAAVDRGVGLNHDLRALIDRLELVAPDGADDAHRDGVAKVERVAD